MPPHDGINDLICYVGYPLISNSRTIKDQVRAEVVVAISSCKNKLTASSTTPKIEITEFECAKEFLKKHQNLLVNKADKGNVTVVMNRSEYESKCQDILNDSTTYEMIKKDPTKTIEKQISDQINT